jgi:hypothetical protein
MAPGSTVSTSFPVAVTAALAVQVAAFLAALALVSAGHKLARPARTRAAIEALTGVSATTAAVALVILAIAEAGAGVALLIPALRTAGAVLAATVWAGYGVALARAVAAGRRDLDCGCSFGESHARLGPHHVLRAGGLALVAATIAAAPAAVAVARHSFAVSLSTIGGALALLALYFALDQLMNLASPAAGALR